MSLSWIDTAIRFLAVLVLLLIWQELYRLRSGAAFWSDLFRNRQKRTKVEKL